MSALDERAAPAETGLRFEDGFAAGYHAAEAHMAAAWAALARRIRADTGRIKCPIPEPVTRTQANAEIWFTADEWASWAGAR